jgi:hypothetical protein
MLAGELIRGQHKGDVPVTGHGVEQGRCLCCRKVFKRWIPSKLARLVRNEMEGLTWGTARELDRDRFDLMMAERMLEVKFCDDACQEKGPMPWPEWLRLDAAELEQRETKMERTTQEPQQEKSNGQHKSQPKHRGQR